VSYPQGIAFLEAPTNGNIFGCGSIYPRDLLRTISVCIMMKNNNATEQLEVL
jgi:hypothetical protein